MDVKHGNKLRVWLGISVAKVLRCIWAAELCVIITIPERVAECMEKRRRWSRAHGAILAWDRGFARHRSCISVYI